MEKCKINVLGTDYRIIPKELKNADVDGYTDNTSKEIVIRIDNANNVGDFDFLQKKQLRHEIFMRSCQKVDCSVIGNTWNSLGMTKLRLIGLQFNLRRFSRYLKNLI